MPNNTTLEERSERIRLLHSFSDGLAYLIGEDGVEYIRRRESGQIDMAYPVDLNPQMFQFSNKSYIAEEGKEFNSLEKAIYYLDAVETFDNLFYEAIHLAARVSKLKEEKVESPYDSLLFEGDMVIRSHKKRLEENKKRIGEEHLAILKQIPEFDKYSKLLNEKMNPDKMFEFFKELGYDI